MNVVS